jgi:hypothetical protein
MICSFVCPEGKTCLWRGLTNHQLKTDIQNGLEINLPSNTSPIIRFTGKYAALLTPLSLERTRHLKKMGLKFQLERLALEDTK